MGTKNFSRNIYQKREKSSDWELAMKVAPLSQARSRERKRVRNVSTDTKRMEGFKEIRHKVGVALSYHCQYNEARSRLNTTAIITMGAKEGVEHHSALPIGVEHHSALTRRPGRSWTVLTADQGHHAVRRSRRVRLEVALPTHWGKQGHKTGKDRATSSGQVSTGTLDEKLQERSLYALMADRSRGGEFGTSKEQYFR